jgi:putative glutathione S-transferase
MSSRDVSHLSDIARIPTDAQGAFKRPASSFRNFIQPGGQFPPEKGTCVVGWGGLSCPLRDRAIMG